MSKWQVYYSKKHNQLVTAKNGRIVRILNWSAKFPDQVRGAWFDTRNVPCTLFVYDRPIPKTYIFIGDL